MKKFIIGISVALAVIIIALIAINVIEPKVKEYNANQLEEKLDDKESFLLVIGTTTCDVCKAYKAGTLTKYVKKPLASAELVFIYADEEYPRGELNKLVPYGINFTASPTTYLIKNGRVVKEQSGNLPLETLKQLIRDNY